MAVYTDVAAEELAEFLKAYEIGEVLSYKGIAEGVENSNFLLHTTAGSFFLTLYEKRVALADLPFFLGLMGHLASHGIPCPQPVKMRDGKTLGRLAGRPAAIIDFLEGVWPRKPNATHCAAIGQALAKMHLAGHDFFDDARQRAFGVGLASVVRPGGLARRYASTWLTTAHER